jgi:hypothetical protein
MSNFNKLVQKLLSEMAANIAGGADSVTGPATSGNFGNQFPSQNDNAYAPNDARVPSILGSKVSRKKKKVKIPIQRRRIYLSGM